MSDKPNCITGLGVFGDPAAKLNELLNSFSKKMRDFLKGINDYDFTRIVCHGGDYKLNLETTELSLFHLLSRYDKGSVATKFGSPNEVANEFVSKLYEAFSNNQYRDQVRNFINKIKTSNIVHQDPPISTKRQETMLNFKVQGKTPLQFARDALAEANSSQHEKMRECIPRFNNMIKIINWINDENTWITETSGSKTFTGDNKTFEQRISNLNNLIEILNTKKTEIDNQITEKKRQVGFGIFTGSIKNEIKELNQHKQNNEITIGSIRKRIEILELESRIEKINHTIGLSKSLSSKESLRGQIRDLEAQIDNVYMGTHTGKHRGGRRKTKKHIKRIRKTKRLGKNRRK